jgi:AraC-like DNA-binding protein
MDILFEIDLANGRITDSFSGINNHSFWAAARPSTSIFAVRFYFWAVPLFADIPMREALNVYTEAGIYFRNIRRDFLSLLQSTYDIRERARQAEQLLLRRLNRHRQNTDVLNAVYRIMHTSGRTRISDIASCASVSRRQLERLFLEYCGASPKQIAGLVRYQYLWQEIVQNDRFDVQDAVYRYGYSDQPHLLKEFKKYHSMTPSKARALARSGFNKHEQP